MPNWVTNVISITGEKPEVDKFLKAIGSTKMIKQDNGEKEEYYKVDFNKIIPQPLTKDECDPEYICSPKTAHIMPAEGREWFNWYNWNIENWGVKWNASGTQMVREEDDWAIVSFDTAWDQPTPVFEEMIRLTKTIKVKLEIKFAEEQGSYLTGMIDAAGGKVIRCIIPESYSETAKGIAMEVLGYC